MATETRRLDVFLNFKEQGKTIKQIQAEYAKLNNHIKKNLIPGTKQYNQAVKKLGGLGSTLARHRQQIRGVGGAWQKISGFLGPLGIAAGVAVITRKVINFGRESVDAFRKQAKAVAGVQAQIKSTGGAAGLSLRELRKEAAALQKNTLFGDEEILSGATNQLLTFTNIAGDEFKRTQKVALDLATVLAGGNGKGDVKSASLQLGKALNAPKQNLSALSRSGIQFTEQQKEMINTLVDSGKLQEAQGIILKELETQYGGAAAAAAKADGGYTQLANTWGDLQERIGQMIHGGSGQLVPWLQKLIDIANDVLDNISPIGDAFAFWWEGIKSVGVAIGDLIGSLGIFNSEGNNTGMVMQALGIAMKSSILGTRLFLQSIILSIDAIGILINKAKEAANFFGAEFELNPKFNFERLEKDFKEIGNIFVDTFTPDEIVEKNEEADEDLVASKKKALNAITKAQEKFNKNTAALQKELQDAQIQAIKDEEARERERMKLAFDRKKAEVEATAANEQVKASLILALQQQLERDLLQNATEFADKRQELFEKEREAEKKRAEERKEEEQQAQEIHFRNLLAEKERAVLLAREGTDERMAAEIDLLGAQVEQALASEELTAEERLLIYQQYLLDKADMEENAEAGQFEKALANAETFWNAYGNLSASFRQMRANAEEKDMQAQRRRSEEQLAAITSHENAKLRALKSRLEAGEISEKQYQKEVARVQQEAVNQREASEAQLAQKEADLKRKQFIRQRNADALQSGINALLSASRALAQPPGPPGTIPLAALAASMGAAQTAAILGTPVPEFARGGVAKGPRHKDNGIKMIDGQTGQLVGEMEGGEPYMILSRNTYGNNKDIIDRLLDSSLNRGGKRIDPPASMRVPRVNARAQRVARMENGALREPQGTGSFSTNVPNAGSEISQAVVKEIRALRTDMAAFERDRKVTLALNDLDDAQTEKVVMDQQSRLG